MNEDRLLFLLFFLCFFRDNEGYNLFFFLSKMVLTSLKLVGSKPCTKGILVNMVCCLSLYFSCKRWMSNLLHKRFVFVFTFKNE